MNSFDSQRVTRAAWVTAHRFGTPQAFSVIFRITVTHGVPAAVGCTGRRKSLFSFISADRRGRGDALQRLAVFRGNGELFAPRPISPRVFTVHSLFDEENLFRLVIRRRNLCIVAALEGQHLCY